jgi:hypothetical protein
VKCWGVESVASILESHGDLRRKQGYTVALAVRVSHLLQVTIFSTLHRNVGCLDFTTLLPDAAIIADEVDAQLKQQMQRFMAVQPTTSIRESDRHGLSGSRLFKVQDGG